MNWIILTIGALATALIIFVQMHWATTLVILIVACFAITLLTVSERIRKDKGSTE